MTNVVKFTPKQEISAYVAVYRHEGAFYEMVIEAENMQDAENRLRSLRKGTKLLGKLEGSY